MSSLAYHPDGRVCKMCDQILQLQNDMRIGEEVVCPCGAEGVISVFPCGRTHCECGGWFGISWFGIICKKEEPRASSNQLETWLRFFG